MLDMNYHSASGKVSRVVWGGEHWHLFDFTSRLPSSSLSLSVSQAISLHSTFTSCLSSHRSFVEACEYWGACVTLRQVRTSKQPPYATKSP